MASSPERPLSPDQSRKDDARRMAISLFYGGLGDLKSAKEGIKVRGSDGGYRLNYVDPNAKSNTAGVGLTRSGVMFEDGPQTVKSTFTPIPGKDGIGPSSMERKSYVVAEEDGTTFHIPLGSRELSVDEMEALPIMMTGARIDASTAESLARLTENERAKAEDFFFGLRTGRIALNPAA